MSVLDICRFRKGEDGLRSRSDIEIQIRRVTTLSILAKCLFHPTNPGFGRGAQSFIPDQHQLLPLDTMLTPWLKDVLKDKIGEDESELAPKHTRDTLIVADEGGMGKTYSALIVATHYYRKHGGSVIVLCPPLMVDEWFNAFSRVTGVKVRRRSGQCLSESTFEDGVTIISKYSLMRHPLEVTALNNLKKKVELCILDEGHEGMISQSQMKDSLQKVLHNSKRRLIATATPIRKSWNDLLALLDAAIVDDEDRNRLATFFNNWSSTQSDNWVNELREQWLPALNRLHTGDASQTDIDYIATNTQRMIPWLSQAEAGLLMQQLPAILPNVNKIPKDRARMARDLHPFGKYMSIALRDDLGSDVVTSLYRRKHSRVIEIPEWQELTDSLNLIDGKNWGKENWRRIVRSCPLNALDDRYDSLAGVDQNDQSATQLFEQANAGDPRYAHLEGICSDTKSKHMQGMGAAVVVFCGYRGTIDAIERWGKAEGHDVFTLTKPPDPLQGTRQIRREENKRRKATLAKAAKSAMDKSKLTLLVCGDSATVGLNMPWATHVVHWDLNYGSVENISQKTWRLDRRWDGAIDIDQDFYVTHLVFEDDNPQQTAVANQRFSNNRVLLGDRRYLDQVMQPPIFTNPNHGFVPDVWNQDPRNLHLNSDEVMWIWDWINHNVHDFSGTAEALWLHALCGITGLELDLEDPIDSMRINTNGEIGVTKAVLHDLITLASPRERPSLQFLAGDYKKAANVMTSFGAPSVGVNQQLLNLLPSGQLASVFSRFLSKQTGRNLYPFVIQDEGQEIRRYAAHMGILRMIDSPSYAHLKALHGPDCPSGLIVREGSGKWEHVTILKIEQHEEFFDIILEYASSLSYPFEVPSYDPIQDDLDEFERMDDYRDLANPFANKAALAGCETESVIALDQHHSQLAPPNDKDFLPLIYVFSKFTERDGLCPTCGKDKSCDEPECDEWTACQEALEKGWC